MTPDSDATLVGLSISPDDVTLGSLTPEQVAYCEALLRRHYGERVAPVQQYCDAFRTWHRALRDKLADPDCSEYDREKYGRVVDALDTLGIPIAKSNLLWRLIYDGQPLRTEKCPVHKGHWSGCKWDEFCECMDGSDVTGWLPNHRLHITELVARFAKSRGGRASYQHHFPASDLYDEKEPAIASALGKMARGRDTAQAAERLAALLKEDGFVPEEWQPISENGSPLWGQSCA